MLNEVLYLGIIFYFPEEKKFIFKHPKSLARIKTAYPKFEPEFMQLYLDHFVEVAKRSDPELFKGWDGETMERILARYFVPKDTGTVLRFDNYGEKPHVVLRREEDDIEKLAESHYKLHFPESIWGDNQ